MDGLRALDYTLASLCLALSLFDAGLLMKRGVARVVEWDVAFVGLASLTLAISFAAFSSPITALGNLSICFWCSAVTLLGWRIHRTFHPVFSPYSRGPQWGMKHAAVVFNVAFYLLIVTTGIIGRLDDEAAASSSGSGNHCADEQRDNLDVIVTLSVALVYAVLAVAYGLLLRDCWFELRRHPYFFNLAIYLVVIMAGCVYRVANDVITAAFPNWILSGSSSNIAAIFKDFTPEIAATLCVFFLPPRRLDVRVDLLPRELRQNPNFKFIEWSRLKNRELLAAASPGVTVSTCNWVDGRGVQRRVVVKTIQEDAARELVRGSLLMGDRVIGVFGFSLPPEPPGAISIVMEFAVNGDLCTFLGRHPVSFERKMYMASDIAQGMAHIHGCGFAHRDLKTANVFVDSELRCKIGDFGSAAVCRDDCESLMGTHGYTAPEALNPRYTKQADVFSFAMVLWSLVADGRQPFSEFAEFAITQPVAFLLEYVRDAGWRPTIPAGLHEDVAFVIRRCWAPEPGARPEFHKAVGLIEHHIDVLQKRAAQQLAGDVNMDDEATALVKGETGAQHRHSPDENV